MLKDLTKNVVPPKEYQITIPNTLYIYVYIYIICVLHSRVLLNVDIKIKYAF